MEFNILNSFTMKTLKTLFMAICMVAFFSCSKASENGKTSLNVEAGMAKLSDAPPPPPPPPPPAEVVQKEKGKASPYGTKLIKKGDITIASANIETTKKLIYSYLKSYGGYVESENLVANDPNSYYELTLNIQAANFEKFVEILDSAKLNIVSRSFSVTDVTLQYVDNATRLENKKKLEKTYVELLSRTKVMKDILEVEEKIESIRADIDAAEGQMRALDNQIAYSAINIRINKNVTNITFAAKHKYLYQLGQSVADGWESVKSFIDFLVSIWPLYVVFGLLYWGIKVWRRRRKAKKALKSEDKVQ